MISSIPLLIGLGLIILAIFLIIKRTWLLNRVGSKFWGWYILLGFIIGLIGLGLALIAIGLGMVESGFF